MIAQMSYGNGFSLFTSIQSLIVFQTSRNTPTVGITSLGLEHTQLLGMTLRDIAWQKGGIIKSGSSVFSTHQHDDCVEVLQERAREKNVSHVSCLIDCTNGNIQSAIIRAQANLQFIPELSAYKFDDQDAVAKIARNPTKLRNSSLAIQLSYDWIRKNPHKVPKSICEYANASDSLTLPAEVSDALLNCFWAGRCQILRYKNIIFYIDGAHTMDSLQLCMNWFIAETQSR